MWPTILAFVQLAFREDIAQRKVLAIICVINFLCSFNVVFSDCEENPCQNGGSCTRHVLDYSCTCPPSHTGDFCENGIYSNAISIELCGTLMSPYT